MSFSPYPAWLENSVFYEVYPQSFQDSNGDGIGDLQGVIDRLDYIASLGCNALWLNPCFESPFEDAGYDISDFYKVAARYGSNADLVRLFTEAHVRGLKVCLDLVAGHTSTRHPWFRDSARAERNEYSDRYIWTDSVWRPVQPGLSQVNGYAERDGNYITNFFHFQPALNYGFAQPDPGQPWQLPTNHPACIANRQEMKNIMRFWLDQGADGFRVDMASSLVKGDSNLSATIGLWNEMRSFFDEDYPEAALIAEWSNPAQALRAGFHIDFMIHFDNPAYTSLFRAEPERDLFGFFPGVTHSFFDKKGQGDIRIFLDEFLNQLAQTNGHGFVSLPTGNHDLMRLAHGRDSADLRVALCFLLTLPGVPCIFAGDEIGQDYVPGLVSKEGGYNRTGSRCPMRWDDGPNAGFSTAPSDKLYLPVPSSPAHKTVKSEGQDPESLLNLIRTLLRLRRDIPALGNGGSFTPLHALPGEYPFIYRRGDFSNGVVVAVNPADRAASCSVKLRPGASLTPLLNSPPISPAEDGLLQLGLPPVSWGLWQLS
jgi:glycosidase